MIWHLFQEKIIWNMRKARARVEAASDSPPTLTFGPALPRNALGKDADWDAGRGAR